ncbi:hypothetical protein D347_00044 [Enterococcus faecalis LA3B-2]|nr:hypothetical protein D347_00044 [Enterococcus faecalis LA3B-2]
MQIYDFQKIKKEKLNNKKIKFSLLTKNEKINLLNQLKKESSFKKDN